MADKIQLTPAELMSQAQQMTSVYEQYSSLFQDVQGLLGSINDSWSAKLASNFANKIMSAQNAFSNVLGLIDSGIKVAQAAASSFESVDSELARLFRDGGFSDVMGGIASTAGGVMNLVANDFNMNSLLDSSVILKATGLLENGNISEITDMFFGGFTGDVKDKISGLIQQKTGLNVDPVSTIQSIANGDILGGLMEIAGANSNVLDAAGSLNPVGLASDFLKNTIGIVTDENSFANRDTQAYADRIMDAIGEGDIIKTIGSTIGYTADVGVRTIATAAGETVSHALDAAAKATIGVSVSEINDKIEDVIGVNPGKVVQNIGSKIGDTYHDIVSGLTQSGTIDKVVSGTVKKIGSAIVGMIF